MKATKLFKFFLASVHVYLLHFHEIKTEGVMISPSGVVSVCSGGQLELTCTVPGTFLEWTFFLVPEGETMARRFFRSLYSGSLPATSDLEVNSITFTFSGISAEGSQPVVSRLLITPVSDDLNGTEVNCTDVVASNTSSTRIKVINESAMITRNQHFEISTLTEQFEREGVTVILELTEADSFHSYHFSIVPQPIIISHISIGSAVVLIKVSYNVHYNVSVRIVSPCGLNITKSTEVYYANCGNPAGHIDNRVVDIMGFTDPAIERSNITFSCSSGYVLNGPSSSICMRNGNWEPDPTDVECKKNCLFPSAPPNGQIIPYNITTEGAEVTYVCWNIDRTLYQPMCKQMNRTAVCTADGSWEPNSDNICDEPSGSNGLNETEKIVIASVIVFVITSFLFFFIGFLCGHFFRKKSPVSTAPSASAVDPQEDDHDPQPRAREEKLELQTNVAYDSVQ